MNIRKRVARDLLLLPVLSALVAMICPFGCARHEAAQTPQPLFDMPERYTYETEGLSYWHTPWWQTFDDPHLSFLINAALTRNFELGQVLARIERAEALLVQARAVQLPQVDADAGLRRSWERRVHIEDTGDAPSALEETADILERIVSASRGNLPQPRGDEPEIDRDSWETTFSPGLTLRWEADLFGRLEALEQSRSEELRALALDYEAVELALSAQVAQAYYEALEQRLQLDLLEEQRELAATFLELLELRFLQGDASALDMLQQRGQVAEIDSEVPPARAQLGLLENRLDVLLGQPPDGVARTAEAGGGLPIEAALPEVGVPLGLLQHRPDLRALQRRVVSADYEVAAAIAERLPDLTLTGSLAYTDASGGGTLAASTAASLFQPLLDWGLRKARVEAAEAFRQELLMAFTQAYLEAIEEVETTLWQEARQRELIDALLKREEILQSTVEEARVRYSLGVTDYLPVLTALQDLYRVQRALLVARLDLVALRIQLYRAIGAATDPAPAGSKDGVSPALAEEMASSVSAPAAEM